MKVKTMVKRRGYKLKQGDNLWSFETLKTVLWAVIIAVIFRTVAYEPFNIPSGSMIPNLLIGDHLFVSKFSYGYSRHSLPFSIPAIKDRLWFKEPKRGDIIVFKMYVPRINQKTGEVIINPRTKEAYLERTDYIKRLIGMPGDKIQVKQGELYLNGERVKRDLEGTYTYPDPYDGSDQTAYTLYKETLPNGVSYNIIERDAVSPLDNTAVYTVPEDHYFVMGDNRDNSSDSRASVGYVKKNRLIGRAEFLFFSHNSYASWWQVWRWPWAIRYSRILRGIN